MISLAGISMEGCTDVPMLIDDMLSSRYELVVL